MKKLWLDDERPAPEGWILCRTPAEFYEALVWDAPIEEASFDHDLGYFVGDREVTGYDILCVIEGLAAQNEWELIPKKMKIHSANSAGRKKMRLAIESIERMRDDSSN